MGTEYKDYINDPKVIYLKTNVDLSTATLVKAYYIKPGESTGTHLAGEYNDHDGDGTNKWIKVAVPYGTLTPSGAWRWQSYVEFPEHLSGKGVHGSVEQLIIYELGE